MDTTLILIALSVCAGSLFALFLYVFYRNKKLKQTLLLYQLQFLKEVEQKQKVGAEFASLQEKFASQVLYDSITGLPGKQVFEDRLVQTLNQSKRYQLVFGVVFLNLDGFKVINDALGHDVGDELLKEVGDRLKHCIRQVDSISRFGGDEFVLILSKLSKPESAAYVAQRLLDAASQPFKVGDQELFITASIGIATFPNDGDETKVLLKNANNALHQAKSRGRNTYQFYHEEMHALSQRELTLSSSLQKQDVHRHFSLYYQPQVNVDTKKVMAMEVLLYWRHPDLGLISSVEFTRLAENNGRIMALGEWVLRNALFQYQQWQKFDYMPESIAITVAMRQLENPHFTYKLSQLLQEIKVEPSSLILEISEIMLVSRLDSIEKSLHMLKHVGVQITIKDFGIGYLSLQHLKRFPIDYLKIAPGLVHDVTFNKDSVAIIRMIVALAKSLQIKVIAEGVESEKQKNLLIELGCNQMQGTLFSPPFPISEFNQEKVTASAQR